MPDITALGDDRIEPIAKKYSELRYSLMPYTYSLAWQARDEGMPLMRAMWLHYPEDEYARGIGDQYLWGRDLLIAPVYEKNARFRQVYLPEGQWYDWWTGEVHNGEREISRSVDLSTMPIYIKAGAIIPIDPVRQYVDQPVDKPTTLRIYPGDDGTFLFYKDDDNTLEYLNGEYSLTRLQWNDEQKSLMIEPAEGNPIEKRFTVELVGQTVSKTIRYSGEPVQIDMN